MSEKDVPALLVAFFMGIIVNQLNPVVTRWFNKLKSWLSKPAPLDASKVKETQQRIISLKRGLDEVTELRKNIEKGYLLALGGIASGVCYVLLALFASVPLGLCYVLLRVPSSIAGEVADYNNWVVFGFLCLVAVACRGFWKLLSVAEKVHRIRNYDDYKADTEKQIAYLEQRLNEFFGLVKP